jgi:glutamine amidotransferase
VIALIDYGAGNLTSVRKALTHIGTPYVVPSAPDALDACSGVIVPGVGHFETTATLAGAWTAAIEASVQRDVPLLGICVGLQWLFAGSEEAPTLPGLGVMSGCCALIPGAHTAEDSAPTAALKVPHVGWNSLDVKKESWILDGVRDGDQVYFTHSFAAPVTADCVASTTYGVEFASVVERDHIAGVQFHPEKSGEVGLGILRNFLRRTGDASNLPAQ